MALRYVDLRCVKHNGNNFQLCWGEMCLIGWGRTIWGSSVLKQNCRQVTACDYQQHPIPQSAFYVKLFLFDTLQHPQNPWGSLRSLPKPWKNSQPPKRFSKPSTSSRRPRQRSHQQICCVSWGTALKLKMLSSSRLYSHPFIRPYVTFAKLKWPDNACIYCSSAAQFSG